MSKLILNVFKALHSIENIQFVPFQWGKFS